MAHNVTATKYRPQTFSTLEGQEFVATALKNSLETKKIANAFLLSGPRGVGKTTTARLIAKGLNCQTGPTGNPCNECEQCSSIKNGNNSDVIEIDGASNTSINNIKIIQEEILYPPVNAKYKVYIIDEVHMLSKSAFNALLKTIEEPPDHVVFIFATTEVNEVPATIRSRCQQFNLRLIPVDIIYQSLVKILSDKGIKYEECAIKWIAYEGHGSMRDAYTLLDQVISFCEEEITLEKIQKKLCIIGEEKIATLVESIVNTNISKIYFEFYTILETGISPEQFLEELILFFRNLLLLKSNVTNKNITSINKVFYKDEIINQLSIDDIENILELSFQFYEKIKYSIDIKIEVEIFLIKLSKYKEFIRPKQLINELKQIQESLVTHTNFEKKKVAPLYPKKIFEKEILKTEAVSASPIEEHLQKKSEINEIPQKILAEKSDLLRTLKSRISESDFDLKNALENIEAIETNKNTMTFHFTRARAYSILEKNKKIITKELVNLTNYDYILNLNYTPKPAVEEKNESTSIINKNNIIKTFNGIEI